MNVMPQLIRYLHYAAMSVLLVLGSGCASELVVTPLKQRDGLRAAPAVPSSVVRVIDQTAQPREPFIIIASFRSREPENCPAQEPYCHLRTKARSLGANTIWIQHSSTYDYPGEWKMIKGQLVQLRSFSTTIIEGVLVRSD